MVKNRVNKVCDICGNPFEVTKCRESSAKYCGRKCYDIAQTKKIPWNKGKTWELLYGNEKANDLKELFRRYSKGKNNPMFGKHHSSFTKEKMANAKEGVLPWNAGKKFPGMFSHVNRVGRNNAYIKYILKEEGISYEEYQSRLSDKEKYYRAVIHITRLQTIWILEHYDKRAKAPGEHAYHLDHIYPIIRGFENDIPPEIIGDISNLRFIHWKANLQKGDKILEEIKKELYEDRVFN